MYFSCTLCPMTFLKNNKLIQHNLIVHKISKTFNCSYCSHVGPSSESVRRHTKIEHGTTKSKIIFT